MATTGMMVGMAATAVMEAISIVTIRDMVNTPAVTTTTDMDKVTIANVTLRISPNTI